LILAIAPVYEALGYASLPVCVAKTHLSPSHRTMPGLPSHPAGEKIDIDADGNVVGLF
jgi:formyltetrahydrofolate synthetase